LLLCAGAVAEGEHAKVAINPIRRVVSMLQMMQKKIAAEGDAEKELYEKFMCWCKTGGSALAKSIADAEAKIPEVLKAIEEMEAQMATLKEEVAQHKKDREAAKAAMAEATAVRKKEAAAFAKETAEAKANIAALEKAIAALSKGAYGFLQTSTGAVLKRLVLTVDLGSADRDTLTSFLTEGQGAATEYAPQSGEIIGIMKQMLDTMMASLADAIKAEEEAIKLYKELMAAKAKEIEAATAAIETKLARIAELGVEIVNAKEDVEDTVEALAEDKKFLADMEKNCAAKTKDWEYRSKMRAEEILALSETIKILNDDDALELFKKTLPSPSLLQTQVSMKQVRAQALQALDSNKGRDPRLNFIALALRGRKVSFEKVIGMIDEMIVLLAKEQTTDDEKKEYCEAELDIAEDNMKELEHTIANLEKDIADGEATVATLEEEIAALIQGIKDLDKAVAEATETRKEENEEFTETMAADTAAEQLLKLAKNRLNKFYNPKLYKPPPKRELTEEERITLNNGGTLAPTAPPAGIAGTGVAVLAQREAPPPPPETYGAYAKKGEESSGVIAMIDLLIKDLSTEMTTITAEEKNAQEDYEKFMADSAEKRAADSKLIEEKEGAKAEMDAALQAMGEEKTAKSAEATATMKYIESLHLECDWLVKNYDLRKEARAGEVEALKNAKAVLSGADYSLVQTKSARLRRSLRAGM